MQYFSASTIPICGFIFSILLSFIFQQSVVNKKTIAITTGVKNTGIILTLLDKVKYFLFFIFYQKICFLYKI